ncbi:hypothetical protein H6P81_002606 [Aristolochia fimbriata]|uniref:Uncharacterized protein n=1 Tax=Aristolochia fimbriata TaxID=158543 RepID=A0AAV7FAX4_ARIFI|nr:hypothetical protein H6P81_002606 [Aristolochia fimbriata]
MGDTQWWICNGGYAMVEMQWGICKGRYAMGDIQWGSVNERDLWNRHSSDPGPTPSPSQPWQSSNKPGL